MSFAIHLDSIGKVFKRGPLSPRFEAVRDVSLSVPEGEVFGFIGPNGAGKSTTIKMLLGLIAPTSGSARIFDRSVNEPAARQGVGYVPENPSLYDYLTPFETLQMSLRLHGRRVRNEREHCMQWLERFELAAVADKTVRGFSKGMVQRTTLANAMVIEPRLLILDEPLSGLDPIGRRDVVDVLAEYRKGGGTIFLTSHVLHDVERLADRFGLIHRGQLVAVKSPQDLLSEERRVMVRSVGAASVPGFVAESGDRWSAEVSSDELWLVLEMLKTAGHSVVEVKPALSLELAFLRMVGHGSVDA